MLVLTRKIGEEICIGNDIVVKVTAIQGGRVRLGIQAPRERRITRPERDEIASTFDEELNGDGHDKELVELAH